MPQLSVKIERNSVHSDMCNVTARRISSTATITKLQNDQYEYGPFTLYIISLHAMLE